jgi:uncharacterized membrane protein YcaP (DUF421 family)
LIRWKRAISAAGRITLARGRADDVSQRSRGHRTTNKKEQSMWTIDSPNYWWHFILRGAVVYAFLLVLLRFTGKRQVGQLAPFDLVLLLVLSNAVQNAMNGGDNSITSGLILAVTLVGLNWMVSWLTYRSKWMERLIEGRPVILVHNGKIDPRALKCVQMTMHELRAAIRAGGCACEEDVRYAVLENNGHVSVIPKDHKPVDPIENSGGVPA